MTRAIEPAFVTAWRSPAPAPQCCHTCWHYDKKGMCEVFFMSPPAEFAATVGECDKWEQDVPF